MEGWRGGGEEVRRGGGVGGGSPRTAPADLLQGWHSRRNSQHSPTRWCGISLMRRAGTICLSRQRPCTRLLRSCCERHHRCRRRAWPARCSTRLTRTTLAAEAAALALLMRGVAVGVLGLPPKGVSTLPAGRGGVRSISTVILVHSNRRVSSAHRTVFPPRESRSGPHRNPGWR